MASSESARYMVVERFAADQAEAIYRRLAERGRMLPASVRYLDSWIDQNMDRCFQLVECADPAGLQEWMAKWDDLVEFEVVPVISSAEASARASRKTTGGRSNSPD